MIPTVTIIMSLNPDEQFLIVHNGFDHVVKTLTIDFTKHDETFKPKIGMYAHRMYDNGRESFNGSYLTNTTSMPAPLREHLIGVARRYQDLEVTSNATH